METGSSTMTWMPQENMLCFPSVRKDGGFLHISPDGQKIIARASRAPELWILENFEPKQQAAR